ncbi:MAG: hypothetical protein ACR2LR_09120 [Hassallia sp.]
MLQRGEPAQRTGSPTPLLSKERGDKAKLYRGEVIDVPHQIENRHICRARVFLARSPFTSLLTVSVATQVPR